MSGAFRGTYRPGALDVGGRGDSEERYTDLVHLLWSPASSQCRQTPSPTKNTKVEIRKVHQVTQFVTLDVLRPLWFFSALLCFKNHLLFGPTNPTFSFDMSTNTH